MIKSFQHVQSGFLSPYKFNQNEITKRCYALQLSRHQDVESVHTAGVNTLDIEKSENRYFQNQTEDSTLLDAINYLITEAVINEIINFSNLDGLCSAQQINFNPGDVGVPAGKDKKSQMKYYNLLSGCGDGSLYIHDVYNLTGQPYYTARCISKVVKNSNDAHRHSVETASWYGTDNALFITSGTDRTLKIWDANSLKSVEKFYLKGRVFHHECSVAPTSNPIIAVAGSVNHVELIDLRTGGSVHELRGHNSSILCCSWSPVEEHLLATGGIDKKILLWDIRSSNCCLKQLDKENKSSSKGTAHAGYINGLKFSIDGLLLVSFGTDNKLRLWETLNGYNQNIEYPEIKNDVKKNIPFAISDNSKPSLIYVPSEGNIYIFEMLSGTLINILNGHFHSVNCCFYRGVYQELYSGGNDRNILIWTADDCQHEAFHESNENKGFLKNYYLKDDWSTDED